MGVFLFCLKGEIDVNLIEELQSKQETKINNAADIFAEAMKKTLIESAENGYSSYSYSIRYDDEARHILVNPLFINKIRESLDGIKVELKELSTGLFNLKGRYIVFNWDNE